MCCLAFVGSCWGLGHWPLLPVTGSTHVFTFSLVFAVSYSHVATRCVDVQALVALIGVGVSSLHVVSLFLLEKQSDSGFIVVCFALFEGKKKINTIFIPSPPHSSNLHPCIFNFPKEFNQQINKGKNCYFDTIVMLHHALQRHR